jgi:hypothetical protein
LQGSVDQLLKSPPLGFEQLIGDDGHADDIASMYARSMILSARRKKYPLAIYPADG